MTGLPLDPAFAELVLSLSLTVGLLLSAGLTIAALPWSDDEIALVDGSARALLARTLSAAPARRVLALSRQAFARAQA